MLVVVLAPGVIIGIVVSIIGDDRIKLGIFWTAVIWLQFVMPVLQPSTVGLSRLVWWCMLWELVCLTHMKHSLADCLLSYLFFTGYGVCRLDDDACGGVQTEHTDRCQAVFG